MAQAALAAAQIGFSIANAALDISRAKKMKSMYTAQGELYNKYYTDQIAANRLEDLRKQSYIQGEATTAAGAGNVAFTGSRLDSALDSMYNQAFKAASQRQDLITQRAMKELDTSMNIFGQTVKQTDAALGVFNTGLDIASKSGVKK